MSHNEIPPIQTAINHFSRRAKNYNHSSNWVDDGILIGKIYDLAGASCEDKALDIAIGTGKIAQAFCGRVKCIVGVDICQEMAKQARSCADKIVLAPAERLPFKSNIFDICVCRQGLQFMKLDEVLSEIYRTLKPGGRVVLCHLTAYGKEDKNETFLIQKLRNPARKNFFLPQDVPLALEKIGFADIKSMDYITRESVKQWVDNDSIGGDKKEKIRDVYRSSSHAFKKIHGIEIKNGDIFDSMKMVIVTAGKAYT